MELIWIGILDEIIYIIRWLLEDFLYISYIKYWYLAMYIVYSIIYRLYGHVLYGTVYQSTLYNLQCTLVQSTMYIGTIYNVHCTLLNVHCRCTMYIVDVQCTL